MLSLETALVTPALVLAFGLVAQFAWLGFQAACFDHAVNGAAWRMTAQDALAPDHDAAVLAAVAADWAPLDGSRLSVRGARIEADVSEQTSPANGPLDHDVYLLERTTRTVRTLSVEADVSYTVDPLAPLPGFDPVPLRRTLDRTFVADARFEVS